MGVDVPVILAVCVTVGEGVWERLGVTVEVDVDLPLGVEVGLELAA